MRATARRFRDRMRSSSKPVTLVVYGWREIEPGTMAWVFPSLKAALRAVRAMRNAIAWLVVRGTRAFDGEVDVAAIRRAGGVLVEQIV